MPKVPSEETLLYDGKVKLKFNPGVHRYWANGKPVPSVTTALGMIDKPGLMAWGPKMCAEYLIQNWDSFSYSKGDRIKAIHVYAFAQAMRRHHKDIAQDAANVGTEVHGFAESYGRWKFDLEEKPSLPTEKRAFNGAQAFLNWVKENSVTFLECEKKIYSKNFEYAGTVDFVGRVDGKLTLADYKTSTAWYDEMGAQVAAYRYAYQEEKGVEPMDLLGLRFDKETGEFETHPVADGDGDFAAFRHALGLYEWKRDHNRARRKQ